MNKKGIIFLILIAFVTTYFFINYMIGDDKFKSLKSYLSDEQKLLITKYIFPYKLISRQQEQISTLVVEISALVVEILICKEKYIL